MSRREHLLGFGMDIKFGPTQDINSVTGLLNIAYQCKRVKSKGLVVLAPQCSPWLRWLAASNHRRNDASFGIVGDESNADVLEGNVKATHVAFLLEMLTARGVFFLLEQPSASMHGDFPSMASAYACTQAPRYHS